MPNSVIQGLTTTTPTGLNRLAAFPMVTLFGLLAHVSATHPQREVRLRLRDILEIIRVGKTVTDAVDRTWVTGDGSERRRRYSRRRYHPRHLEQVHDALLALHNQSLIVRRRVEGAKPKLKERIVHLLDSFGYVYEIGGRSVDVDDLPQGWVKVNIGTDDRPVWRLRRRTVLGEQFERPTGILFRINAELASELANHKGTIGFTVFALRVFDLFREFVKNPAALRLLVLVLRQTGGDFTRVLGQLLDDLGWDSTHPGRAVMHLNQALERLRGFEVVRDFTIDREADRVTISVDKAWYQQTG